MKLIRFSIKLFFTFVLMFSAAMSQWTQTNGPGGGGISAIASNGTYMYAASGGGYGSGIYVSKDNGLTWKAADYTVNSRDDKNILCIAASGASVAAGLPGGWLLMSTDSGATWTHVYIGRSDDVTALYASGNTFYAGTNSGGGFSWTIGVSSGWNSLGTAINNEHLTAFYANGSTLYASAIYGYPSFWSSPDSGATWTTITAPSGASNIYSMGVFGGLLYVGTNNGVFSSTNNGTNWSAKISGMSDVGISMCLSAGKIYVAGYNGVYSMATGGTSFTQVSSAFGCSTIFSSATGVFVGSTGTYPSGPTGVLLSTDGGTTWKDRNSGLAGTTVEAMMVNGSTVYATTKTAGLFSTTDNGTTWTLLNMNVTGNDALANALAIHSGKFFAPTSNGMTTSTDGGTTWVPSSPGFTPQAFFAYGSKVLAGNFSGVSISTDNGTSWTASNTGLPGSANTNGFGVHGSNLFVFLYSQGIYVSTDSGATWTSANTGLSSSRVRSFTTLGSMIFVATDGGGIYKSTDDGANWQASGISGGNCWSITSSGTTLYAGSNDGVSVSHDSGATWNQTSPWQIITNAVVVTSTNVFAGGLDAGVWRVGQTDAILGVADQKGSKVPAAFRLMQNYPNPFNPSATIEYSLAARGPVTLKIFNVLGENVRTLVNEVQGAGNKTVKFDGANLSSGVYFYRLQAGSFVSMKKMVLMK
ncbi:MAG TPA: T9SS type A sorting domain-containing protein [Bacteroidota bacterium]|nr:T9SS type A sorting domain-containing protein [Bacteroidota bacterium]